MNEIKENVSLEMENVLSYRGKVTQQQMVQITQEMQNLIESNGAHKTLHGVSATYGIENTGSAPMMEVEIMYPLDKPIAVSAPYVLKPVFRLRNAVKIRHTGNPALMQNAANELMVYIKDRGLMPITAGYNVTVQEPTSPTDIENLIVDMYVGVSDNIL